MDDSSKTSDRPELETLGYKPGDRIKKHPFPKCNCVDCNIPIEQPVNTPSAALGFNSHIIKPETRANKSEDAEELPEQPNQNLMIIEEIEGLMSQVNEKLHKIEIIGCFRNTKKYKYDQALEEIDLFQKTTLFELRKANE